MMHEHGRRLILIWYCCSGVSLLFASRFCDNLHLHVSYMLGDIVLVAHETAERLQRMRRTDACLYSFVCMYGGVVPCCALVLRVQRWCMHTGRSAFCVLADLMLGADIVSIGNACLALPGFPTSL